MLGELPEFARDPQDAHVLATALSGAVDSIVSEDKGLLDLGEYEGIPIVTAATFLDLLAQAGHE